MSRILIVEDNAESRYILERLLASKGHRVITAENGEDALRLARQDPPEVIISGIMMPGMNGFRFCREVKRDSALQNIPFIFYAATFVEKADEKLAMSLGASRFIVKPAEGEQFIRILDKVLDEHRQGILPVPEGPQEGEDTLLKMYDNGLVRKLAETVEKLQNEQRSLIRLEGMLKEAQELAQLGYWELDLKSNFLEWSDEIYRILGLKPRQFEASQETFMEAVHPDDRDFVARAYRDSLVRKTRCEIEYRLLLGDGTVKYVNERFQTIYDDGGAPTCTMGTVQDITEQQRVKDALRQSEYELSVRNRINEIFLTIPHEEMYGEVLNLILEIMESRYGIFGHIDEDGAWACPSLTGDIWDQCKVPGKEIIFPREQWGGLWGRAMVEKKALYSNKPFTVPEGHISIARALDVPIIYRGSLIGNILVANKDRDYSKKDIQILEDIANNLAPVLYSRLKIEKQGREKRQVETQFYHAQKMEAVGILAGGVAHDFNNLLTMIIGNAQLVLNDLPRGNPLWEDVEEIRKAGQRGAALTRQLLAFGRSEIIRPEILDLNEIVKDMTKLLKRLIRENIELHTILAPDLWKVYVDPGQIEQVVMNLVVNAGDVMLGGGTLTIETDNVNLGEMYFRAHGVNGFPGSYVMLAITDTGPGMDKDVMAKIFEPFFTTKEREMGTGLGLSVVYGIVKQSKGYVWPYSEPGVGTTMKVYLPRAGEDTVSATIIPPERVSDGKGGGGEVVLVVEDEESVRKLVMKSLQREGYKVLVASNGQDALRMNEQTEGEIHLLITDVIMPGMEGRELAARMVILRPGIKVVYMSGYPGKTLSHNGVFGLDANFLQKPFTPEILCRKVRDILGHGVMT